MIEFPQSILDGDIELIKLDPTFENARQLFELIDKNRDFLGEWLNWVQYIKSPEDEFDKVKKTANKNNGEYFILFKKQLAGCVGFVRIDEKHQTGEIGYFLGQEFSGNGIMTIAVKMFTDNAFENYNLNRIEIRTDVKNIKSLAVPVRLKYNMDGVLRAGFKFADNDFRDINVYSKLKSEWLEENKNA